MKMSLSVEGYELTEPGIISGSRASPKKELPVGTQVWGIRADVPSLSPEPFWFYYCYLDKEQAQRVIDTLKKGVTSETVLAYNYRRYHSHIIATPR